jgi:hypothetical protein
MDLWIEPEIAESPSRSCFRHSTAAMLTWLIQFHESAHESRAEAVSPVFLLSPFKPAGYGTFTGSLAGGMTLAVACWRGGR